MKSFPYTPAQFAKMIIQEADRIQDEGDIALFEGEGDMWTRLMKNWLKRLAEHNGLDCICTDRDEEIQEFMLDLVWYEQRPPKGAVLACESEWGNTRDEFKNPDRVVEDFDKLLSFKSLFKLMMFDSYNKSHLQGRVLDKLNRYLQEFGGHCAGEQYLVVDISQSRQAWVCEITADGEDRSLQLNPLDYSA